MGQFGKTMGELILEEAMRDYKRKRLLIRLAIIAAFVIIVATVKYIAFA